MHASVYGERERERKREKEREGEREDERERRRAADCQASSMSRVKHETTKCASREEASKCACVSERGGNLAPVWRGYGVTEGRREWVHMLPYFTEAGCS